MNARFRAVPRVTDSSGRRVLAVVASLVLLGTMIAACGGRSGATGAVAGAPGAAPSPSAAPTQTVRVAYQRSGLFVVARARGVLADALKRDGIALEWVGPFPDAPSGYEAVNSGSADLFASAAAPAVSALAGGAPVRIVAASQSAPSGRAVLVHRDSPVQRVEELVGRKVAVQRGNVAEFTLLKTLEARGVPKEHVERVYIAVQDAATALAQQRVDAWVTWDPYIAVAETQHGARIIADGSAAPDYGVFVAREETLRTRSDAITRLLERLAEEGAWANANVADALRIEGEELKLPPEVVARLGERPRNYAVLRIDGNVATELQNTADWFHEIGVTPQPVTIAPALGDVFVAR